MKQVTLGFLVLRKTHENGYATEIAKRSSQFNIQCVRFEPASIHPSTLLINGEKFDHHAQIWEEALFPIPTFIYDRCFYHQKQLAQKSKPIMDWLKKYPQTTFLGFGLPDKWKLYTSLQSDPIIRHYLPYTERIQHPSQIVSHLQKAGSCLLKPVSGSRGIGIVAASYDAQAITITYHREKIKKTKHFQTLKAFAEWCEQLIQQQAYLLQPLLPLLDKQRYPFDIRMFFQKDQDGKWHLVGKGVRKGYQGSFLSNLHSGGEILSYEEWSSSLTSKQKTLLEDELQTIADHLPPSLEKKWNRLFEIGVDIGYATDGSVWILDTNSKPGRKTIAKTNPTSLEKLFQAPLAYCHFLQKQGALKGVEINE